MNKFIFLTLILFNSVTASASTLSYSNIKSWNGKAVGASILLSNRNENSNMFSGTFLLCDYNLGCRKYPIQNVKVTSTTFTITFPWKSWFGNGEKLVREGRFVNKDIKFSETAEMLPIGMMYDCSTGQATNPNVVCPNHSRFRLRSWNECDNNTSCGD